MSRKNVWTAQDIPAQDGRMAIVTGSSSGIGLEAARQLARKGARVVIAVRNAAKGERAVAEIRTDVPDADVELMMLDLADLSSVRAFADEFLSSHDRLDLLINNAGVMMPPYAKTADGFEIQIGTNHFGHFALTGLLFECLLNTPRSRIVNVSSIAHSGGDLDFDDLDWQQRDYRTQRAYGDSKLANLFFTYELVRRLEGREGAPVVTAAHPGWTATDLQRHSGLFSFLNRFVAQHVDMGALPTLRAATDEAARPGDYFGPDGWLHMRGYPVVHASGGSSHDVEAARRLWEISEQRTGVRFDLEPPGSGTSASASTEAHAGAPVAIR